MNMTALLALLADLYAQLQQATSERDALRDELAAATAPSPAE